jgi:NAD(P)H-dependent FMN reductase
LRNTYDQGHGISLHLVQSPVSEKYMLKIAIIIGSTRPGRKSEAVAKWAYDIARHRSDAEFELLDLADFNLPLLDEPLAAMSGQYSQPHTCAWSARVASFDGYVFVTPEYNHGVSSALKNAIDFLYREWADKASGFIGYGYTMGARAIEHLRLVMSAVQVATVRPQVGLSLFTDFENSTVFKPAPVQGTNLHTMLEQVIAWSGALQTLREKRGD